MAKINVLSFEIANLIAAGEVVERPSSVLKELLENSIDSGATRIVAEIKRGGVALIRVTDNGCGIDKEDLPVSLKRHATSKISTKDDLDSIITLGFRGEALAAISSVSAVTIITKTKDAEVGAMLTSEAGNILDISEVGTSDGTTVVVENLFYNVPARRKFLKKDATEAMNVTALVEKVALSRPDISIQLLIDGVEKFKTPGDGKLKNTIYSIFGKDFSSKLIEIDGEANGIKVTGFIGRSDNVRKNRNMQNVFINGRYVKSLTVMAAIEKAFTSYIAPECFPTCVLNMEMSPSVVDVNVHPAKLEVKFSNEQFVFEAVYYTVKRALEDFEYRPEMVLESKQKEFNPLNSFVPIGADTKGKQISFDNTQIQRPASFTSSIKTDNSYTPKVEKSYSASIYNKTVDLDQPLKVASKVGFSDYKGYKDNDKTESITPKRSFELLEKYKQSTPKEELTQARAKIASQPEVNQESVDDELDFTYKIIGEAFDCYVMVEYDENLLMIDKHAAHERILFEELKKNSEKQGKISSQALLLPITVLLAANEVSVVDEYKAEFSAVGFEFTINGTSADITAIPDAINANDAEGLFIKMADELVERKGNPKLTDAIRREKSLYQIACKAAIKGGRVYDKSIIEWLVKKVLALPDITVCPHGRPIAYKLTKKELDKQFDRIK